MDISVVLATYKRSEILQRTLESFRHLEIGPLRWDLWVVDNADDSATESVVKSWAKAIPIKYLVESQAGKNNALNRAIDEVQGQLIVLTDDDIIATSDWLTQMWQGAQRWPEHVIFGGRILPFWPDGFKPLDLRNPYLVGAYAIANWSLPEREYSPEKVFGANMAVRRKIFDDGWRFNASIGPSQKTNYIMGSESEFVLRLEASGHKPVFLPEALVYHQIRPDQMSFKWLRGRAYRAGLGSASLCEMPSECKVVLRIPRYLIRRLVESYIKYLFFKFTRSSRKTEAGMRFYTYLGMVNGHYHSLRREE